MLNLSNREQGQSIANKKDVDEKTSIDLGITGAEAGEVATVAAVDENGKPTAWIAKKAAEYPVSISVQTPPTKLYYIAGDSFDPTGMVVIVAYSNGVTEVVPNSELTFSPGTLSGDGEQTVTITYIKTPYSFSTAQSVTVTDPDTAFKNRVLSAKSKSEVDTIFAEWWNYFYTEGADKTALLNRWFGNVLVDDRVHGAKIPLFATSTSTVGELTGDSEELTCTPSTASTAGQDDFAALPQFWILEASQEKNADGTITTYYIQHIDSDEQVRSGEHLCQVLQKNTYYREWDEDGYRMRRQQCTPFDGAERHAPTNAQGITFEFVANPKYSAGKINGVMTCGTGLAPVLSISLQGIISQWRARSSVYCGANYSTLKFLSKMMALKYARKGNSGVIEGCFSYNLEYTAAVSETGVERVIVTTTQGANFLVGSSVCIGARGNNARKITSIETVEIEGTTYTAINIDNGGVTFDVTAGTTYIRTMPYFSGYNDTVLGNDGSRTNYTNGKEPGLLQGIEFALGAYLITGDEIMNWVDSQYLEIYTCDDPANAGSAITEHYTKVSTLDCGTLSGWQYIQDNFIGDTNFPLAVAGGASSSNGVRAALYVVRSSGLRACWRVASLNNGGFGGLSALHSANSVGSASWYGSSGAPSVTR